MLNSQRGAKRRVGYNNLISKKREWNNCFIKNAHKISLNFVRTNRKRQGTSAIHMSHVYQNCQRANGLAWTAWMKNQNIVAMNISFLKTHRDSRILHSRTAKKTWQIMWRKIIFKWQPSKLLWIWIFGAVTKVRTTEKNYYLGRLLWSCLKPQAGFAEQEKKLYWRLDCCSEWLHSLYSGCLWFIFFMSDKQAAVIYQRVTQRVASQSWRNNTCLLS